MNFRPLLKEVKKAGEVHIVLDCSTEKIQAILKQAMQVGMMTAYHNYLITSLVSFYFLLLLLKCLGASNQKSFLYPLFLPRPLKICISHYQLKICWKSLINFFGRSHFAFPFAFLIDSRLNKYTGVYCSIPITGYII